MGAPKGNQFWKQRSKHGRDKLFATPELLWEAACEYFQWCDDNPLIENKVINSSKLGVVDHPNEKVRPYTLGGLCLYLGVSRIYFIDFKKRLKDTKIDKDFSIVVKHIEETIYEQQFSNAAADLLNSNIIARSLGLADKKQLGSDPENPIQSIPIVLQDGRTYEQLKDELKPE